MWKKLHVLINIPFQGITRISGWKQQNTHGALNLLIKWESHVMLSLDLKPDGKIMFQTFLYNNFCSSKNFH